MNEPAKEFRARHHFRFRVPLQVDCCYFYGMAERHDLNKLSLAEKIKRIEGRKHEVRAFAGMQQTT